ncbi:cytochrome P450 [Neobacillus sp. 114]|uniref:cytochrome P450 n=1 Tax=Neobacillus sp. 114 TaxID=3048535 RepID=UPI0032E4A7D1
MSTSEIAAIPQPKTYGPLGNMPLIDKEAPTLSLWKIAEKYGPIFRMEFFGGFSTIFVSGHKWAGEVLNSGKFDKSLLGGLHQVREFAGDGLFTGKTSEPNWQKAHNILMPSFSLSAMKGYHSMMVDIASQLVQKWARLNPNDSIDVPDDMTRLTLDTIGLCGFNYRFNSFYRETHDPFIINMVNALDEAMHKGTRLPIQDKFMVKKRQEYQKNIQAMFSLVDKLIAERKERGDQGETDLLARMLSAKDPQTGEMLDDENIRYQIITFLIAGHETTSGLLSFTLYLLLKHPEILKKARAEVDSVLTGAVPTFKQVLELKYIRMILNESLRLYPTAPQFTLYAKEDLVLGGKYKINKKQTVAILLPQLHRDKEAWGEDAEEFRPERFEDPKKIPHDAYKPFGNGQRACIGMQFALHEATLLIGMILQNFDLIDHTNYQLKIKQTLTLKPENFTMSVQLRDKRLVESFIVPAEEKSSSVLKSANQQYDSSIGNNTPLLVLYGSNMGTAEGIAKDLATSARFKGFKSEIAPLDEYVGVLPKEGVTVIVTSSYNGNPPKNARKFVKWMKESEGEMLDGVRYAVFGCGDTNWANTYQSVPNLIDEKLAEKGANRISPKGQGDASSDFDQQFEDWHEQLWPNVFEALGLKVENKSEESNQALTIQFVDEVQTTEHGSGGTAVQTVKTRNSFKTVERVLNRFALDTNTQVVLSGNPKFATRLPLDFPVRVSDLLSLKVNLEETVTRPQLQELAEHTVCPPHQKELETLINEDAYKVHVVEKGITMLDLLEKYPACQMPFEKFLELLAPYETH